MLGVVHTGPAVGGRSAVPGGGLQAPAGSPSPGQQTGTYQEVAQAWAAYLLSWVVQTFGQWFAQDLAEGPHLQHDVP